MQTSTSNNAAHGRYLEDWFCLNCTTAGFKKKTRRPQTTKNSLPLRICFTFHAGISLVISQGFPDLNLWWNNQKRTFATGELGDCLWTLLVQKSLMQWKEAFTICWIHGSWKLQRKTSGGTDTENYAPLCKICIWSVLKVRTERNKQTLTLPVAYS